MRISAWRPRAVAAAVLTLWCAAAAAQDESRPSAEKPKRLDYAEAIRDKERQDGLLPIYLDRRDNSILLEVPAPDPGTGVSVELLYFEGLRTGLGSNPVGLDRGQIGDSRLVRLRPAGWRLLVEAVNLRYRARTERENERAAVEESFATSVLWAGDVISRHEDGRLLVDFTDFAVRDAHGVARTLQSTGQGEYKLDPKRSALRAAECLGFPDNVELEAWLTFAGKKPGDHVRSTAPDAESVTLVQHHSLVRFPDDDYRPRVADPRVGYGAVEFLDYAAPLDQPLRTRLINRHRLQKIDPAAARSAAREPIVYFVDPGAPPRIRDALLDGARWWAAAFDAAGFQDAYRVEVLPDGAHPLDVRYNVIQWVHRSTRGWSYGNSIVDPRTGEIIKGHVSLGSLRVRQDRLLFEGMFGADATGQGGDDDPLELALARIRQLSAHEVGHTLGLSHNFAASTFDDRASVMDYPAPRITVDDTGRLSGAGAYGVGVGSWDVHAIRYGYTEFPSGADESDELRQLVEDGLARGLVFLSDDDARPASAAEPRANLWDNGDDPAAELERLMRVRGVALKRFGVENHPAGQPVAYLQEVLVPVYLHHRYQVDAAAKMLGGTYYHHAVRGEPSTGPVVRPVPGDDQRRALNALLAGLNPAQLDLPDDVLALLPPRPHGAGRNREMFRGFSDPTFDPLGAAAVAAELVLGAILQRERAARIADQHRRDPALPGLDEVTTALVNQAFVAGDEPRHAALRELVQVLTVERLIGLARDPAALPAVQVGAGTSLRLIQERMLASLDPAFGHGFHLLNRIRAFIGRTEEMPATPPPVPSAPPGSPIGHEAIGCSHG